MGRERTRFDFGGGLWYNSGTMALNGKGLDLGRDPVGKLIVKLAVPAVVAQIINLLYNLVDRMYVGGMEGVGTDALAGLGSCSLLRSL